MKCMLKVQVILAHSHASRLSDQFTSAGSPIPDLSPDLPQFSSNLPHQAQLRCTCFSHLESYPRRKPTIFLPPIGAATFTVLLYEKHLHDPSELRLARIPE
ncbi:hypothetical protein N7G274_004578 [Stereocaulon virgatum]|uniref:Uncharacterized protein n=1 Tax=Stereocaulon virgatum TaxID=373712 RepID=A0ABR4AHE0_9LECA